MPENLNNNKEVTTAYPSWINAQDQTGSTGLDNKMDPPAVWTQIEHWDNEGKPYLKEYEGRGQLEGKAALITGGDSGIGRSVAILMAREGADITICYLPAEQEDADWTIKYIEKAGRKAHGFAADLRDHDNAKKAVEEHMRVHGRLNILVPNAAQQEMCMNHKDIDLQVMQDTFQLNILSMMAICKYALHHMPRGSVIINCGSVAGYMGNPTMVDYSATKGAISAFTRALAQQQAPHGIRVNSVAPGIIWTPLQPATKGQGPEGVEGLGSGTPMGRPGMPVEVAVAFIFLATSTYTTGETTHVTGALENQG